MTVIDKFIFKKMHELNSADSSSSPRKKNINFAGRYFLSSTADTAIGLGFAIGSIFTMGMNQKTWEGAKKHLFCSRLICSESYKYLLKALNPQAEFPKIQEQTFLDIPRNNPCVDLQGNGLFADRVHRFLRPRCKALARSENIMARHLGARGSYALMAIALIVARLFDGVIGVGAAVVSIATFGKWGSLNNVAYRGLQATGVVKDLFICISRFFNPTAGNFYRGEKQLNLSKAHFLGFSNLF